jgi:hypothetical protein
MFGAGLFQAIAQKTYTARDPLLWSMRGSLFWDCPRTPMRGRARLFGVGAVRRCDAGEEAGGQAQQETRGGQASPAPHLDLDRRTSHHAA